MRLLVIIIGLLMTFGCGMNPPPLAGPVSVSGKVVESDGQPVGGVVVNLQPLENGYMKAVEVKSDGTFAVETQAGKYAYFFTPKSGTKAVPSQVAKLAEASLDRTVNVAFGQELVISLP
jgi:hypothetical protein